MAALDIAIVGPALPAIQNTFSLGERDITWVFSIYVLFNLLGTPILAALSDMLGRRAIYLLAVGLFTAGSLITAIAWDYWIVLLGRVIQGAGAGGIFPVASALIWDHFPATKRGRMLGLLGAVFGLAFLVGPILGGVLLLFSWHWLFLINLPIGVALLIAGSRVLPASRARSRGPFDWAGMLLLSATLTTFVLGLNRIAATRFWERLTRLDTGPLLVACIVFLLMFVRVELASANPVVPVKLFARRQVALVALLAVGAGVAEAAVVFMPQLLKANFYVSASTASFMLIPLVVAMSVTSPTAGRFVDHIGSRSVLIMGSALIMSGMLLIGVGTLTLPQFYVASILTGIGLASLLGAPLRYILLNEASTANIASTQGILTLLISIGQLSGGVLMGAVAQRQDNNAVDYQTAFILVGLLGLLLTVTAFLLKAEIREEGAIGVATSISITADIAVDGLEHAVEVSHK